MPRKKRNHSKAASRTKNVDREEEDEDMVVVTTTTTSNFADKNVDIVSTTEDSTAGSTATESIGTVEHTDLDEHGDAHEVDQDRVLETEDVFANTESHISVENDAENESLVSTDVEVVASTELNANGVDKFERAHITREIAPRRSTRVRKKPAWQQSGNYCMGISKQTMMLQSLLSSKSRKEKPQKLTQLSSRSHPRHLVGKRTAQKDITIDTTSDSQVNSNFPNRWSPASLTFNNYFYLFLYLYIKLLQCCFETSFENN